MKLKIVKLKISKMVRVTDRAWLIEYKKGKNVVQKWLPKSQCTISNDNITIIVPEWIMKNKRK